MTDEHPADRLVRFAMAEESDRLLAARMNYAMWGGEK